MLASDCLVQAINCCTHLIFAIAKTPPPSCWSRIAVHAEAATEAVEHYSCIVWFRSVWFVYLYALRFVADQH